MAWHAKRSPSSSHEWIICHGNPKLISDLKAAKIIPRNTQNENSAKGTAAHWLVENCLQTGDHPADYEGDHIMVDANGDAEIKRQAGKYPKGTWDFEVDEDMIDATSIMVEYVLRIKAELGEGTEMLLESRIDVSHFPKKLQKVMGGTADVILIQPFGRAYVIDYKHGVNTPVSAEGNTQMMYYAQSGAAFEDWDVDEIMLTIVQPRCPKTPDIQEHLTTADEIRAWGQETLLPAIEATMRKDAPLVPGEKQCHWCDARGHCDAAQNRALQVTTDQNNMETDPKKLVTQMPSDRFVELLNNIGLIKKVCKAAEERAHADMMAGQHIPGWKLVQAKKNRKWKPGAAKALLAQGLTEWQIYKEPELESFTKLLKMFPDHVEEQIYKPEGGPVIAPESDKRPAIDMGDAFDDVGGNHVE